MLDSALGRGVVCSPAGRCTGKQGGVILRAHGAILADGSDDFHRQLTVCVGAKGIKGPFEASICALISQQRERSQNLHS